MNSNRRIVFFVEWDTDFVSFIKGITLSPSPRGVIVLHIFYRQEISTKFLPKYKPWLFKHPAASEQENSAWDLLESYVKRFNFGANYSLSTPHEKRRPGTAKTSASLGGRGGSDAFVGKSVPTQAYYVISKSTERCKKLAETVDQMQQVKLECVEFTTTTTLLDFLQFKCPYCRIAFTEKRELDIHDRESHGFVCPNQECKFNAKENSFRGETELKEHIKNQLRCAFCPTKVFCSSDVLELHKRSSHKKCPCPCGKYYGERLSYLDHFFAVYPSPSSITSSPSAAGERQTKGELGNNRGHLHVDSSRKSAADKLKNNLSEYSAEPSRVNGQSPNKSADSCSLGGSKENVAHEG